MTAIAPNTDLRMGTLNLMDNGEDTIYFTTLSQQTAYMINNLPHVFTKYTYQREHRDYLKIELTSEQEADKWDYMMFRNTTYGDKWFYAFITETEWINNLTVKIHYKIDYVQTYLFEYSELECFIERMHTESDDIGDNIMPEPVDCGEYIFNKPQYSTDDISVPLSDDMSVIFLVSDDHSTRFDNIVVGGDVYAFRCNETSSINSFLSNHTVSDNIEAAYSLPTFALSNYTIDSNHKVTGGTWHYDTDEAVALTDTMNLDGYRPQNKKLYTYPYNFYYITDNNGNNFLMRYEFCKDLKPRILYKSAATAPPYIVVSPDPGYYRASQYQANNENEPVMESIFISGFPMICYAYDSFKSWAGRSFIPNMIKLGVSGAIGYAVGGPVGAAAALGLSADPSKNSSTDNVSGFENTIATNVSQGYSASIAGDLFKGSYNSGSVPVTSYYAIKGKRVSVQAQYAVMIDNFFTMYGYAIKRYGMPQKHNRTRFTYIKTTDCHINGDLPTDAKRVIASRYNKGIRFWVSTDGYFRDYSHGSNLPFS